MGGANAVAEKKTAETKKIEQVVGKRFPNVEAYRYNSASIRVRVIDEAFLGKSKAEREQMLASLLDSLPDKTQRDITILLLLAPEETTTSMMNVEFEQPSPSDL